MSSERVSPAGAMAPRFGTKDWPMRSVGLAKPVALAVVLSIFALAYWRGVSEIAGNWVESRGFYSHGLLVLGMVLFILYQRRAPILSAGYRGTGVLVLGALGSGALWLIAWAADIYVVGVFATFAVLCFAVVAVLGAQSWRATAFPLSLLLLIVPVWGPLQPLLQNVSSVVVTFLLHGLGFTAHMADNVITIPQGIFEVEQGCSGLNFLLVSLALVGFVNLSQAPGWKRATLALVGAAVLGVVANWLRIFFIVIAGYFGGMENPLVREHVWFGWVVYLLVFFPYLFWAQTFCRGSGQVAREGRPQSVAAPLGVVLAACLALSIMSATALISARGAHAVQMAVDLPMQLPGYARLPPEQTDGQWMPAYQGADRTSRVDFLNPEGQVVSVYTATFFQQRQGQELVNVHNDVAGGAGRVELTIDRKPAADADLELSNVILQDDWDQRTSVWYWYLVGNAVAGSAVDAKLVQVIQKLRGRTDGSVIALASRCEAADCERANRRLEAFYGALQGAL